MEFITDSVNSDFRWGYGTSGSLTEVMFLDSGVGRLSLPYQTSNSGILLGGDVQLFRGAANRLDLDGGDSMNFVNGDLVINRTDNHCQVTMNATGSTSQTLLWFQGESANKYVLYYDGNTDYFALNSKTVGGDPDIFRVPDAQTTIDANTTWDENVFDWVCEDCGWHGGDKVDKCPSCKSTQVFWHDDAELMHNVTHTPWRQNKEFIQKMEKLGLINTYGTDDEVFISLNRMPGFLMSGIAQLWNSLKEKDAVIDSLSNAIDTLTKKVDKLAMDPVG